MAIDELNSTETNEKGLFGIADDYTQRSLSLDKLLIQNREAVFFFEASGHSMSPTICEGDILLIDCARQLSHDDIIVGTIDGEHIFRRFIMRQGRRWLVCDNPAFSPILLNDEKDFSLFGPVSSIIRRLK